LRQSIPTAACGWLVQDSLCGMNTTAAYA
jgi:hypothetical protein